MRAKINEASTNSTLIKIIALIVGYSLWHVLGNSHTTTIQCSVPLCFYNIPTGKTINAPEQISIQIIGKRSDIRSLDTEQLALHIDAELLHDGKNLLAITQNALFLPESMKLIHYSPSNPIVELIPTQGSYGS